MTSKIVIVVITTYHFYLLFSPWQQHPPWLLLNFGSPAYVGGRERADIDIEREELSGKCCRVVLAESGDMSETYGNIETCRQHVGRIGERLIAKRTYI